MERPKLKRTCITIRPLVLDLVKKQAAKKGMTVSCYINDLITQDALKDKENV